MFKIKSFSDIAVLLLRLVIGIKYLQLVYLSLNNIEFSNYSAAGLIQIISLVIFSIGSLLLILGLFGRWASGAFVVYFLLIALAFGYGRLVVQLLDVVVFASIWLIGSGKYSLDYKFFAKK